MALTAADLDKIKTSMTDVVQPRFDEINRRFDNSDNRFREFKDEFDQLSASTNRKFHTVFADMAVTREDLHVVKQMVTEHGFRLAQLESRKGLD